MHFWLSNLRPQLFACQFKEQRIISQHLRSVQEFPRVFLPCVDDFFKELSVFATQKLQHGAAV